VFLRIIRYFLCCPCRLYHFGIEIKNKRKKEKDLEENKKLLVEENERIKIEKE